MKKSLKNAIKHASRVVTNKKGEISIIPSLDDTLKALNEHIKMLEEERDEAYKALEKFNKEKEIVALHNKLDDLSKRCPIIFSDKEMKSFNEFWEKHSKCHQKGKGSSKIQIEITYTGVGSIYKLTCPICGKSEDITDIHSW